jgi:probable phosphoglycerate mutase
LFEDGKIKVYLVRHLATPWNAKGVLQGRKDISIDGVSGGCECSQSKLPIGVKVFTSELVRTQQTAKVYGFSDYEINSLLNEFDFGDFEGRPKSDLLAWNDCAWRDSPSSVCLGESILHLKRRIFDFLSLYLEEPEILIFGHGCWIRLLYSCYLIGTEAIMNRLCIENGQVLVLEFDAQFIKEQRDDAIFRVAEPAGKNKKNGANVTN